MKQTNKVIGRGLGSLLEDIDIAENVNSICEISVEDIKTNPNQPRKDFDEDKIEELASSIKKLGLIQPITLQKQKNGKYLLIAGERRYRAAKSLGLDKIAAYLIDRDEDELMEMSLVENIQRQDLNPIEIALSLEAILRNTSKTQEELSQNIGKSRASISNYIRLLKLPADIQLGLSNLSISMGHARALLSIDNLDEQLSVYHRILKERLSVREVEDIARAYANKNVSNEKNKIIEKKDFRDLSQILSNKFGTKVSIEQKVNGKGKLTISIASDEDLERIIEMIDRI